MGQIIKNPSNYSDILKKSNIPIILCSPTKAIIKSMCFNNSEKLLLNEILAGKLLSFPQEQRWQRAYEESKSIMREKATPLFLQDFEMLFNPQYQIDVLRLFYEVSRSRRIVVNWCGEIIEDRLTFSSPEYKDYHSYKINDYDVTCII